MTWPSRRSTSWRRRAEPCGRARRGPGRPVGRSPATWRSPAGLRVPAACRGARAAGLHAADVVRPGRGRTRHRRAAAGLRPRAGPPARAARRRPAHGCGGQGAVVAGGAQRDVHRDPAAQGGRGGRALPRPAGAAAHRARRIPPALDDPRRPCSASSPPRGPTASSSSMRRSWPPAHPTPTRGTATRSTPRPGSRSTRRSPASTPGPAGRSSAA
jgi:hypothetical protein